MDRKRLLDLMSQVGITKDEVVSEPAAPAADQVLDCVGTACSHHGVGQS